MAGKTITVLAARVVSRDDLIEVADAHQLEESDVYVGKKQIILGCEKEFLELDRVKPEGKKEMAARDFAQGLRNHNNLKWEGVE